MGQNHTMTSKGVGSLGTTVLMERGLLHRCDSSEANLLCSSLLLQRNDGPAPSAPPSFLLSCFQKEPAFLPCLLVVSLWLGYDRKLGVVMHTHNPIYSREAEAAKL